MTRDEVPLPARLTRWRSSRRRSLVPTDSGRFALDGVTRLGAAKRSPVADTGMFPWGRADISLSDDMKNDLPDDISKPPHYADVEGFGLGVGAMTMYDGCIKPVGS